MPHSNNRDQQYTSVRRVLWSVLTANLVITALKITLGIITGALAVVADGFHSLIDSSSNLIGLAAVRLAAQPPDERHPYGYQKYETLGALAIGGLLLVAVWEIIQNVIERLFNGSEPEITWFTLGLMILTFPVNLGVVILETRAGKRLNSKILLADAAHTRTDLYVTLSVIVSMVGVWLGWVWLDLVIAAGVVIIILRAAFNILRDSAAALTDVIGIDPGQIEEIACTVPGVRYVHNIRSRGSSDAIFVDLHVKVDPVMSTSQAHAVASEVERCIQLGIPQVIDAVVHIEPARIDESTDWEKISYGLRQIADGMGLGLHDLNVHVNPEGNQIIEVHIEFGGEQTLGEAHQLADEFEQRSKNYWPQAVQVITHLEPLATQIQFDETVEDFNLSKKISTLLEKHGDVDRILEIYSRDANGHKYVNITVCMPPDTDLADAHAKVEQIERTLLVMFPEIHRVILHVEPTPSS